MLKTFSLLLYYIAEITKRVLCFTSLFTFWDGVFFSLAAFLLTVLIVRRKKYRFSSISINLPFSLGNVTYEPTELDRVVAWKLYTHLKTRKAALLFDEKYDVIADIYDSLYELFPISRSLLEDLPINEVERSPGIADLVFRVQNDGIRPHLTKWQADFRKWWNNALKEAANQAKSPQEIQKGYPKYGELISDLKKMNLELNKYAEDLMSIAKNPTLYRRKLHVKEKKVVPLQPVDEIVKKK